MAPTSSNFEMSNQDKYMLAVLQVFGEKLDKLTESHRGELGEALHNSLFGLDGPKQVDSKPDKETQFLTVLFSGLSEISNSYESLRDAELYIRRFPFNNTRVTRDRYLKYVIENHLHEIYVLKERLLKYLKQIERLYRKDQHYAEIKKGTIPLYKLVSEGLKKFTTLRNSHVHELRVAFESVDRISLMELLNTHEEDNWRALYYKWQYKEIRKYHKKQIEVTNNDIEALLNIYFSRLHGLVFHDDGHPRYPTTVSEKQ